MPPTPLKKQKPDRQDRRSEPPESEEEWALWKKIQNLQETLSQHEESGIDLANKVVAKTNEIESVNDEEERHNLNTQVRELCNRGVEVSKKESSTGTQLVEDIDQLMALRSKESRKSPKDSRPSASTSLSFNASLASSSISTTLDDGSRSPNKKRKLKEENVKQKKLKTSRKTNMILPAQMVAAKQPKAKDPEENWILATVIAYNEDSNTYDVEDADEESAGKAPNERFRVPAKYVIPLSKSGQQFPHFAAHHTVLALYPLTTCFYKAEVVLPPSKTGPQKSLYVVAFEDDDGMHRSVEAVNVLDYPKGSSST